MMVAVAVVAVFAAAFGIVLLAARIVVGWISPSAGAAFGRGVMALLNFTTKLSVVVLGCLILYAAFLATRGG